MNFDFLTSKTLLSENVCDNRNYYIPFSSMDDTLSLHWTKSDRVMLLSGKITYKFSDDNQILVSLNADVHSSIEYLPRLGYGLHVDKSFDTYNYLGYGSLESYVDKIHLSYKDYFSAQVTKDFVSYIKPQESTSHCGTSFVNLLSKENSIKVSSAQPFSFSAVPYSIEEIETTAHNYELPQSTSTYLNIDYKMSGVGSNACGPKLAKKYTIDEKNIEFSILLEL